MTTNTTGKVRVTETLQIACQMEGMCVNFNTTDLPAWSDNGCLIVSLYYSVSHHVNVTRFLFFAPDNQ